MASCPALRAASTARSYRFRHSGFTAVLRWRDGSRIVRRSLLSEETPAETIAARLQGSAAVFPEEKASPLRVVFSKRRAFQDQCTRQGLPARICLLTARDFPEAYPASRR